MEMLSLGEVNRVRPVFRNELGESGAIHSHESSHLRALVSQLERSAPEVRVHAETGLIERIEQGLHLGHQPLPLRPQENAHRADYFHAQAHCRGASLEVVENHTALLLRGEGDRLGLSRPQRETECGRQCVVGYGCGRKPVGHIPELPNDRWRCQHGVERPREQIELPDPLQRDQAARVGDDDFVQESISFSRSSGG